MMNRPRNTPSHQARAMKLRASASCRAWSATMRRFGQQLKADTTGEVAARCGSC
jgi:hypothetical protein